MQLFILDYDPETAATMLCDVHLRKMCLETPQILSSVLYNNHLEPVPEMPRPYNPAHPVIRAINNPPKINWTVIYNESLHQEYLFRFGKVHAYGFLCRIYRQMLFDHTAGIPPEQLNFARNFKDITIDTPDIVMAYREYYRFKKHLLRFWHYSKRDEPSWLK